MGGFSKGFSMHRRAMVHTAALVVADSAAMFAAFEIARWVRSSSDRPVAHAIGELRFAGLMFATMPFWVMIFGICGLYMVRIDHGRVSETGRILAAVFGGVMLLISLDYLSFEDAIFPSHSVPVIALIVGIPLVIADRQIVRLVMRAMFRRGRGLHNVILLGTGDVARRIADQLDNPWYGYRLLSAVRGAYEVPGAFDSVPVHSSLQEAIAASSGERVDQIVQADISIPRDEAVAQMAYANSQGISYRFVPDLYGVYAAASTMAPMNGVPVMEVRLTSLGGWGAVGKRIFDAVGAVLLLAFLFPVMIGIAVTLKLTEPGGPVFYIQERLGSSGRPIGVMKFRTMSWRYSTGPDRKYKTAEDAFRAMGREDVIPEFQIAHKVAQDPRVTRLGNVLRKTSLDELPQLFNVLRGQLSLVGPRPITPVELSRYGEQAASFLALKPGITGLWQVQGRSSTTYEERVRLDIYYVENWTLSMDVSILARTLVTVTARRGAV